MLLTVFCAPRNSSETTFALDVSPELELRDFVALCELESGIPAGEIQITYAEQPLRDPTRSLGTYGLKDGDVVVLRQAERRPPAQPAFPGLPRIDFSSIAVPSTSSGSSTAPKPQQSAAQQPRVNTPRRSAAPAPSSAPASSPAATPPAATSPTSPQGLEDPALLRDMLLANPHELSLLKERNPPLAEALLSGDLERFTKVLLEQQQDRARRERERIRLLTADPFDLEAQAKIEEDIRQHNIEENMTIAMEEAPESFGQVVMLYINCKVNGHPVKAFVDSGAQMTIMSQACAERCNIMRLVDRRWAGIAKGVGTQKIIGRVHLAQVQIEGDFLPCSFSILEDQPMDMLLGLDMLKRHQCSIDLKKSVLLIGTTGSETRFLPEGELPECARLAYGADGREETRPEEIADRELAEALQRSVQESDAEDGQTTSSGSAPKLFYRPSSQDPLPPSPPYPPTSSSPASSLVGPSRMLDRSQSAPTPLPSSQPGLSNLEPQCPKTPDTMETAPSSRDKLPPALSTLQESPLSFPNSSQSTPKDQEGQRAGSSCQSDCHRPVSPVPQGAPDSLAVQPKATGPPTLSTALSQEASAPDSGPICVKDNDDLNPGVNPDLGLLESEPMGSCGSSEVETRSKPPPGQGLAPQEKDLSKTGASKRTCPPLPAEGHDAGGKRSPLPVPRESSTTLEGSLQVPSTAASSSGRVVLEECMDGTEEGVDDLERDQPEGGSSSSSSSSSSGNGSNGSGESDGSNNIPSLAQALKELHQLLVSNRALSPSACRPDADGLDKPAQTTPTAEVKALTPPPDASKNETTLPLCPREDQPGNLATDTHTPIQEPDDVTGREEVVGHQPDSHWGPLVDMCENDREQLDDARDVIPPEQGMNVREPPEGQQGRGEADGRDFGTEAPTQVSSPADQQTPSPLSLAVGSSSLLPIDTLLPTSTSPSSAPPPPPPPLPPPPAATHHTGDSDPSLSAVAAVTSPAGPASHRFPGADIQRIQAAGFSAQEAVEALEQTQGSVELALLLLLARKISVPT